MEETTAINTIALETASSGGRDAHRSPEVGADAHLSVVFPVCNGVDRLPRNLDTIAQFFRHQPFKYEVILVDDGSASPTADILRRFVEDAPGFTLLRNEVNRGKGYSVSRGMLWARGAYRVFADSDLAYPVEEVGKLLAVLESGSDVAVACRVLPESRYLMSPAMFHYLYSRHLMSRAFNLIVRTILLPGILDSQAGLKGFTARAAELIFRRLTIRRFGFDVELLRVARRHGLTVTQIPVAFRYDSEPTTVRFAGDGVRMIGDVVKVRWNELLGRYR